MIELVFNGAVITFSWFIMSKVEDLTANFTALAASSSLGRVLDSVPQTPKVAPKVLACQEASLISTPLKGCLDNARLGALFPR